jgi:alpha-amylase
MWSRTTWDILDVGAAWTTLFSTPSTRFVPLGSGDSGFADRLQESYYHPFCLIDYNNDTSIQVCWEGDNTVSLPDLRTEDSDVLNEWESWITALVANYSIDGLRVDSAREVDTAFFPPFQSAGMSCRDHGSDLKLTCTAGVYIVGEVDDGDPNVVCPFQQYMSGVLNYPA